MKFFGKIMKLEPFEQYIRLLQGKLMEQGVRSQVFRNPLPHQWFHCMWTAGQQKKLRRYTEQFELVIVFGCDSAFQTVKDSVKSNNCKVISGMKVAGIMNATLTMDWTGAVSFKNCRLISPEKLPGTFSHETK